MNSKLLSNILTGAVIAGSLTTSGVAGYKVFASRNVSDQVPELTAPTPRSSPTSEESGEVEVEQTEQEEIRPDQSVAPNASVNAQAETLASPSPASVGANDFPVASTVSRGSFDDEDESEREHELEREDQEQHESEEHRSEDEAKQED